AELYDPATGRFTQTGGLPPIELAKIFPGLPAWANLSGPAPFDNGSLVALPGGDALLVGNTWWWKHQGELSRDLRYSAATGTWTLAGRAWLDVWSHGAAAETWTSGVSHYASAVSTLADGRVVVAGGTTGIQYQGEIERTVTLYDPATGRWTAGPPMPHARAGAAAVRLASGDVMLVGGYSTDDERWTGCDHAAGTDIVLRFTP
ncbi:MAG TPA: kelch repeat-containing protein, partial [Solirubrobacterales bacterium]